MPKQKSCLKTFHSRHPPLGRVAAGQNCKSAGHRRTVIVWPSVTCSRHCDGGGSGAGAAAGAAAAAAAGGGWHRAVSSLLAVRAAAGMETVDDG